MLDIGIIGRGKGEDFKTKFLNELIPGEEISGEIYIGEIKNRAFAKSESFQFAVILTDHENKRKWVCKIVTSYYPETGNIYGEKGGRVYTLIDTLNHVINNDPLKMQESYSVNFNTFRHTINDNITSVTVKAVHPVYPQAKYVNLEVLSAEIDTAFKKSPSPLEDILNENAVINIAYKNLKGEGKDIKVQNIAFELKSMMDRDEITQFEFKNALKKLDTLQIG